MSATDHPSPAAQLARADTYAAEHQLQLTPLRRQVYECVVTAGKPIGAYDLLAALEPHRGRVPPTTVYRALDFLVEHGFVHRIESKNAFVACCEIGRPHQSQFLICERCGDTLEIPGEELASRLSSLPPAHGFEVHKQVVELSGLCGDCKDTGTPSMDAGAPDDTAAPRPHTPDTPRRR